MKRRARIFLAAAAVLAAGLAPAFAQTGGPQSFVKERRPTALSGAYLAGRFAGSLKDIDAAADFYRRALEADPKSPSLLQRAFMLAVASGNVEEGIRLARRLVAVEKSDRFARLTLAVDAIKKGAFAEARTQLQDAGRGPLAELTAGLLRAWVLAGENKPQEALAVIDALEGPEWYGIFKSYHGGLIAARAGRNEEAEKRLKQAYDTDRTVFRTVEAYARFKARQGQTEEAIRLLRELEGSTPGNAMLSALLSGLTGGRTPEP
ncbi:MAG: tetratricopeptide repeat protein, partial [Pseudomonadota bacterium]|nr:tetratricopeptide repeat protein [Pseudomonadota bacterium]